MIKILFFGDVFSKTGRQVLYDHLPELKNEFGADFVVINGENLADGRGLTEKTTKPLFNLGVDAITGGNHLWDRANSWDYIRETPAIVKAMNFPDTTPGNPCHTITKDNKQLSVITLCGQMFMTPCDSPFVALEKWLQANPDRGSCVLVDFHAESTAEKRAMAWFADGHVSALLGTHTHIQTADEEILPQGTAYITDVGMTGAHDSVIGVKKSIIIAKFRHALPSRYESSDQGMQINAVYLELDSESGKALKIERIRRSVEISTARNMDLE